MHALNNKVLIPGCNPGELVLTFAGNIVKHLGVQMYAGRPVPAIAELISNSWDADATVVSVHLPLDEAWDHENKDHVIEISDNGNGMTWDMVRDAYLDVGRDRREAENTDRSPGGRPIQGRKGVGKLAGFGIADVMEVQTVYKDVDEALGKKLLIWFSIDIKDLYKNRNRPAPVNLIFAGPISKAPAGGRKKQGTTVILRQLHQKRSQNSKLFHHNMAQRFLLIGPRFRVLINGRDLQSESIKLQWRWPKNKWSIDTIDGYGSVEYWIGSTHVPRKQNEGELSGILVYTRGKISQEATFFDVSGGFTGQHGLRYLVGMVKIEWLDSGVNAPDLISTHRGSIAWESPQGVAFKEWGQRLVRSFLSEWAKRRAALREQRIKEIHPNIRNRIERLAPSYRDIALQFVDKFKTVEMEPGEFEDILSWFLDALENATLRSILQKLRETNVSDLQELDDLLSKMEVRTAVTLLQIIDSNLTAIDTLERMHKYNAKERGVISKHLEKNPWLIHPTWMLNKTEARVSTWIKNEFGTRTRKGAGDNARADFFCVAVGGTLHIVEIKRGIHVATDKDILQADKYRTYILKRFSEISDKEAIVYRNVQSHLIASSLHDGAEGIKQAYDDKGWVVFTTWDDLIERAKLSHRQFREILAKRASELSNESDTYNTTFKPTREKIAKRSKRTSREMRKPKIVKTDKNDKRSK